MDERRRLLAARVLATLAIVSLPAFIWLGWWQLGISIILAIVAAAIKPTPELRHLSPSRRSRLFRAIQQRIHPHSWRPGRR